jgi:NADPH-dependent 2,4-dienoyl-CoA reductase/sulfur reductase-like enzyme/Fe-S-cluster-containing hydrogenase component 2/bacterioferritin-associated ferredoxin
MQWVKKPESCVTGENRSLRTLKRQIMDNYRINQHPILPIPLCENFTFYWNDQPLQACSGDTIASALFANGIRVFGHHPKDGSPQGIFCANGQCSQCLVIVDCKPLKACMELVKPDQHIMPADGLPVLPKVDAIPVYNTPTQEIAIPVLIIGGGPAGLSAGIELAKLGIHAILLDDKHRLGGKLVLQTHRFFGSAEAVYAGTRGIDIATKLEKELLEHPSIDIWLQSTALAVFSDKKVGVLKDGDEYVLIKPEVILVASGAREKFLPFKGNTLPGVYGAGAFQTLVNRDLVRPAEKLFIVGGGNVGLIAGYHALQAGIKVAGLVEALPECGGYKVHKDKLVRMGIPIYTSHTILSANGDENVQSVTIAKVDEKFQPISGTEKSFECDSVLIAVGLDPVDEFYVKAREFNLPAFAAGDAEEIAEASAAIFSGKIKGLEIAKALGHDIGEIPQEWYRAGEILKSKPGKRLNEVLPEVAKGFVPVLHCTQEIPCNPCAVSCAQGLIEVDKNDIRNIPRFIGSEASCKGCLKCVAGCPGLAITLLDYRADPDIPLVSIPYEFGREALKKDDLVTVLDTEGRPLGKLKVVYVRGNTAMDRTWVIQVKAPKEYAARIAGIQVQSEQITQPMGYYVSHVEDDTIVCRCERVTAAEIRKVIHEGLRDINEIKAVTRAGMGSCGAKTCNAIILRIFKDEGIPMSEVVAQTKRPVFVEVPLEVFAGSGKAKDVAHE